MFLPGRNSATEMFANLGIHSFDEMLKISYDLAPCKRILFIVYIFYLTAL